MRHSVGRRTVIGCVALLVVGGCTVYDPHFEQAARQPVDPSQPILGAWDGSWTSDDGTGGVARLVVARQAGTNVNRFDLLLVGFNPTGGPDGWFRSEAIVDPATFFRPIVDFDAKMPVVLAGGLCLEALGLQGHVDGDAMAIQYWTNDAQQAIDAGRITLRRASRR